MQQFETSRNNHLCPKVVESSSTGRTFSSVDGEERSKNVANERFFWAKVDKAGQIPAHRPDLGPCWNWTGCKNSKGYGCFAVGGKSQLSHRVSVILSGRTIPDGLTVDHLCRNIVCVNPGHLDVVTMAVNNGRQPKALSRFCGRGHEYTPENTILKHGMRNCRECTRLKRMEWKEKRAGLEVCA